ncbi:deoxyribose-phosphate aldolase [Ornithinimicrobium tianjinense]|uniref:Deoxyribose-phosphate aldolase n=1 Tax=Ornithinimicrobium tianjinense TaxID=1195761 RepID=A0A917BP22_9MICO|nr:deoxyribose-phosphate aldolase [Ornithinimicrobium tianjinense]GGF51418.1 deoxyribose-phosphate aldolase [Ornithinimicrobium tianjinense]
MPNTYAPGSALTVQDVADLIDHALLKPELTPQEVEVSCRELAREEIWSVCVRPSDVSLALTAVEGHRTQVCTVIGFPHGTTSTAAKVAEARQALADGATELDMVLNIGRLRGGDVDAVREDIAAVVEVGHAEGRIVKVIFETALLDEAQKVAACRASEEAGADFVKTSTGFAGGGATLPDVRLMRANTGPQVQVKASGGVRDIDTLLAMCAEGVTRIGTSSTAALLAGAREREAAGTLVVPQPGADVAGADGQGY